MTTWGAIERLLTELRPRLIVECSQTPPRPEAIAEAERFFRASFPKEFRALLAETDALYIEAKPEFWPKRGGGPAAALMNGFGTFGIGADVPKGLRLDTHLRRIRRELRNASIDAEMLPVLQRVGDDGTFGYVANRFSYWSPSSGKVRELEQGLFDVILSALGDLRTYMRPTHALEHE
ncbi:MAG: hypothetical protein HOW73_32110 [Polyangiaceae bacterium]|nr:hypothetical protein [Polyangiaceae bacterium]